MEKERAEASWINTAKEGRWRKWRGSRVGSWWGWRKEADGARKRSWWIYAINIQLIHMDEILTFLLLLYILAIIILFFLSHHHRRHHHHHDPYVLFSHHNPYEVLCTSVYHILCNIMSAKALICVCISFFLYSFTLLKNSSPRADYISGSLYSRVYSDKKNGIIWSKQ